MNPQPVSLADERRATIREDWDELPIGAWFYCYTPSCRFPHSVMERTSSGCTSICSSPWTHPGVPAQFRGIAERHNASALLNQHVVAEPQVSGTKVREILEESSTEQEVSSGADGVYTYRHCDTYEVANRLNAMLPAAHAAEQPKENWEPVRGQYVWVEGKLTENQPETFPKKLRVYVHGVGTGIAENVRPVTETEAEQLKLTEEQVQSIFVPMLNERAGSWEPFPWDKLVERLNRLLTSPVAPPQPQPWTQHELEVLSGLAKKLDVSEFVVLRQGLRTYQLIMEGTHHLEGPHGLEPPVAPGEQPPQPICRHGVAGCPECKTGIFAAPPAHKDEK